MATDNADRFFSELWMLFRARTRKLWESKRKLNLKMSGKQRKAYLPSSLKDVDCFLMLRICIHSSDPC